MSLHKQESETNRDEASDKPIECANKGRFIFPRRPGLGVVQVRQVPAVHHMAKIIRLPQRWVTLTTSTACRRGHSTNYTKAHQE